MSFSFRDTSLLSTVLFTLIYFDRCLCTLCTYSLVYILLDEVCAINMLFIMHYYYVVVVFSVLYEFTVVGDLLFTLLLHCATVLLMLYARVTSPQSVADI